MQRQKSKARQGGDIFLNCVILNIYFFLNIKKGDCLGVYCKVCDLKKNTVIICFAF